MLELSLSTYIRRGKRNGGRRPCHVPPSEDPFWPTLGPESPLFKTLWSPHPIPGHVILDQADVHRAYHGQFPTETTLTVGYNPGYSEDYINVQPYDTLLMHVPQRRFLASLIAQSTHQYMPAPSLSSQGNLARKSHHPSLTCLAAVTTIILISRNWCHAIRLLSPTTLTSHNWPCLLQSYPSF